MKILKQFLAAYFTLLLLFTCIIISVHFIPRSSISENVIKSVETIQEEGLYKKILNFKLFQLDNYTDAIMLNESVSGDSNKPVESAMMNYWNKSVNFLDLAYDTENFAKGKHEDLKTEMYGRYWHGYLITLKPLLVFFDYSGIRIINYFVLFVLFLWCLYETGKNLGYKIMIFLGISFFSINFFIVPLSLQFSSVFYIALISIILLLRNSGKFLHRISIYVFFFAIGAITSFFDLLTAPIITLSVPATIYLLKDENNNTLKKLILISISWGLGYALLWASKWGIGMLLTENDFMTAVKAQIGERTNKSYYKKMEMTLPNIIYFMFFYLRKLNLIYMFWLTVSIAITMLLSYIYLIKSRTALLHNITFLLIILMFPAWFFLMKYHTIQHGWFTWRSIIGIVFGALVFVDRTIDWSKIKGIGKL